MRKVRLERTMGDGESRVTVSVEIESDYTTLPALNDAAAELLDRLIPSATVGGPSKPELVSVP